MEHLRGGQEVEHWVWVETLIAFGESHLPPVDLRGQSSQRAPGARRATGSEAPPGQQPVCFLHVDGRPRSSCVSVCQPGAVWRQPGTAHPLPGAPRPALQQNADRSHRGSPRWRALRPTAHPPGMDCGGRAGTGFCSCGLGRSRFRREERLRLQVEARVRLERRAAPDREGALTHTQSHMVSHAHHTPHT